MKFDKLYPEAKYLEEFPIGVVKNKEKSPCRNCGVLTYWMDLDSFVPICSTICQEAEWNKNQIWTEENETRQKISRSKTSRETW